MFRNGIIITEKYNIHIHEQNVTSKICQPVQIVKNCFDSLIQCSKLRNSHTPQNFTEAAENNFIELRITTSGSLLDDPSWRCDGRFRNNNWFLSKLVWWKRPCYYRPHWKQTAHRIPFENLPSTQPKQKHKQASANRLFVLLKISGGYRNHRRPKALQISEICRAFMPPTWNFLVSEGQMLVVWRMQMSPVSSLTHEILNRCRSQFQSLLNDHSSTPDYFLSKTPIITYPPLDIVTALFWGN